MKYENLEDHIGYWLRLVSNAVHYSFRKSLEENYGLGIPEWVALRSLAEVEKCSLNELQTEVGTDKGALSRIVEKLKNKKLVERNENSEDRRSIEIKITTKGKKLLPGLVKLANENEKKFFSTLSGKEKETLLDILKHVSMENKIINKPIN